MAVLKYKNALGEYVPLDNQRIAPYVFDGNYNSSTNKAATIASITSRLPGDFTGADGTNAGTNGLVPQPAAGDNTKFLKGDGTWGTPTNTNTTAVKKTTVSGTEKLDATLISADSTTGLSIEGATNGFKIGNGTNYITVGVTPSIANNVTGSGLTSDKIVLGNSDSTVKTSNYSVTSTNPSTSSDDTTIPTSKAVWGAISDGIAANDAMIYKGTIAGGNTGTYGTLTPAADAGYTYKVSADGKIDGVSVKAGDLVICNTDNTAAATEGNYATIAAKWDFIQTNTDGFVTGPASSTASHVAVFDGTTGKLIKDSGFTIGKSVPSNAVFTDNNTKYKLTVNGSTNGDSGGTDLGTIYAPSGAGSSGQFLKSTGSTPTWETVNINNGTFTVKAKSGNNTSNAGTFTANQSTDGDITFIQGSNVTLTTDASNHTITIDATDTDTKYKLTVNGSTNGDGSGTNLGTIYAPSGAGSSGQFLKSTGSTPTWETVTIPAAANDGKLNIKTNVSDTVTTVGTFTANQSTNNDITFIQGANVTLTPDGTNNTVTIAATDTTYQNLGPLINSNEVSLVTRGDKWKLATSYDWVTIHGSITATSVAGVSTSKSIVIATPSKSAETFSLAIMLQSGREMSVIVFNDSQVNKTITIPHNPTADGIKYYNLIDSASGTMTITPGGHGEINIISAGNNSANANVHYIRYIVP